LRQGLCDEGNAGPYFKAVEDYTESIKLNSKDAKVGYGMPRLYNPASSSPLELHHVMISFSACIQPHHMLRRPCHAAYSNRAACHTHLGAFAAAIEDAETCIALEPAWVKGYSRKGCAELHTEQFALERPG
jgi:hypothetical protein